MPGDGLRKENAKALQKKAAKYMLVSLLLLIGFVSAQKTVAPESEVVGYGLAVSMAVMILSYICVIVCAPISGSVPSKFSLCEREEMPFGFWFLMVVHALFLSLLILMFIAVVDEPSGQRINKKYVYPVIHRIPIGYGYPDKEDALLHKGEYQALAERAQARLSWNSRDVYGYYYLGLAQYYLKDYENAAINLRKTQELSPTWEANYTEPYLKSMEGRK